MTRDWFLIVTAIACLWGLWLLLQFVFDQIEDYHAAWRERTREFGDFYVTHYAQPSTEDGGKQAIGAEQSDSR